MNIIVYATSNRSGGAYSVLADFYNEVVGKAEKYPDIKWIFLLSSQKFESRSNVTVINCNNAIKSWLHRLWFGIYDVNKIVKENNVKAIVSLQNMRVVGCKIPTIISLHNILPAYNCNFEVFDSLSWVLKQNIINRSIISSMKKAYKVFVSSEWVKEKFVREKGIEEEKIIPLKCRIPAIKGEAGDECCANMQADSDDIVFFYPATPYPYKNHKVIVDACKRLKDSGIDNYKVIFTFVETESTTAQNIAKIICDNQLNIELTGALPRKMILNLYKTAVLLFPSKIEMDAMPLIECTQLGGFVLSANLPYAIDVLKEYRGKKYFEADDAENLYLFMKDLIINGKPEERFEVGTIKEQTMSRVDKIVELVKEI